MPCGAVVGAPVAHTLADRATPCALQVKNHYSVPVQWLILDELTDDHAIFKVWPTEQDRIAVTHVMEMPKLVWDKVEEGFYYMSRRQYDLCDDQL